MITRMNHTGFVVKNLDKSVEFYRDVVGLALDQTREAKGDVTSRLLGYDGVSLKVAFLSAGNGHALELIQYVYPPGGSAPLTSGTHWARHTWHSTSTIWRALSND